MNYLLLGIGLLVLIKGADIMVESASKIAKILKVPAFIMGLFIVAIGTSAPEASIGVFSAIQGNNLLTLGDVVGSSIVNIALVLGITAMVIPLKVDSQVPKREMPFSIFIQIILILMLFTGGVLSRLEAVLLLSGMILFTVYTVLKTKEIIKHKNLDDSFEEEVFEYIEEEEELLDSITEEDADSDPHNVIAVEEECIMKDNDEKKINLLLKNFLLFIVGLTGLIVGAKISVNNAIEIAYILGLSETFIGLTVVAFGTSLPELVTCLIAAFKKEDDIAVGNIIGSNIFNVLFVLGISGIIHPIYVNGDVFMDMFFMVAASVLLLIPIALFEGISKKAGFVFLTFYVVYIALKLNYL